MRRLAVAAIALAACGPKEASVIPGGGGGEIPVEMGDRSERAICDAWREAHAITSQHAFTRGAAECGPGALTEDAIADTLKRIDMFRWLAGLGPVDHDETFDADAQACSAIAAFWDFNRPVSAHTPPPDAKCFTEEGRRGAGASNISWGVFHPAGAIDSFMQDSGANNADSLGHRRWILNPPLGPVGVGYFEGGSAFGAASCLRVFGTSGTGPRPAWNAVPPAGFAPIDMTRWTWSFQGSLAGISSAGVKMELSDGSPLDVDVQRLQIGAGEPAVGWVPRGWTAEAGKTYHVTIEGLAGGDVSYDVTPVSCL